MTENLDRVATYSIKNLVTGDAYVGSTSNWRLRRNSHMHMLRKGKHHSVWLQRAWNKYGQKSFVFLACYNHASHQEAVQAEQAIIEEFFLNGLYNCKPSAVGVVGCNQPKTEQHKKAISIAATESWQDPDMRERRQSSMRNKREVVICPNCGLSGGGGNMNRYHFDNCKKLKGLLK